MNEEVGDFDPSKAYVEERVDTEAASDLLGVGERRIRQIAQNNGIGVFRKNRWTFTWADLNMLDAHVKRGKSKKRRSGMMKDVTPQTAEHAERVLAGQEQVVAYVREQFLLIKREFFQIGKNVWLSAHNETIKLHNRHEKQIYNLEEAVREMQSALKDVRGVLGIPDRVRALGRHPEEDKDESGRGVSILGRTAPSYPVNREAAIAA